MHEKKPLLDTIGRELNINVNGIENYTIDHPSLIIANHTCIKDIFAVPAALPEACQIVLSARLMWKRNNFVNSLLVYLLSNKFKRCSIIGDIIGLAVIPISTSWWVVKTSFDCAANKACNLPGLGIVIVPTIIAITFNYYLAIRFKPKLYIIAINVAFFIIITILAFYLAPQILNISNPWKLIG